MERRTLYLVGVGLVAGAVAWWLFGDDEPAGVIGDLRQAFRDAIDGIVQGARLTHAPYDKTTGVVPGDPQALADQAGATLEEYALARNIASEEGNSSAATQALVAHATKNAAGAGGIAHLLLRAKNPDHNGRFGTQADLEKTNSAGRHPSDRYASTAQDPYAGHLAIARGVLDGSIPDLTGGATQYDRPSGESDPDAVAQKRLDAGSELVNIDDVGQGDLRFWRPVS